MGKKVTGEKQLSILSPELRRIFPNESALVEREFSSDVQINKDFAMKYSNRARGSVRIVLGRFKTKQEHEQWRNDVIATELP